MCVPFVGVLDEQPRQQRLGVGRQRSGELDLLHEDELKQLLVVLVVERQAATHHLIHHHTQTPPVHCPPVVVVLQHLRRKRENLLNCCETLNFQSLLSDNVGCVRDHFNYRVYKKKFKRPSCLSSLSDVTIFDISSFKWSVRIRSEISEFCTLQ